MTKFKLFVFTTEWKLVGTFDNANQASVFRDIYYDKIEKWSINRDLQSSNCSCNNIEMEHNMNCVRYKDYT